jgi:O-acetyl-ADP-ribose deacetylase (regulator of RNase III)
MLRHRWSNSLETHLTKPLQRTRRASRPAWSGSILRARRAAERQALGAVDIHLTDVKEDLVEAWRALFVHAADIFVHSGSILDHEADAIVSPANSFGFMDGGIDLLYSEYFGRQLQDALQAKIRNLSFGELPVGQAMVVETGHEKIPFLISAPTMRVPMDISQTVNCYLAFRAALIAAIIHNQTEPRKISSVLVPGLGTGVGRLSPEVCAKQMFAAYVTVREPWFPSRLGEVVDTHWSFVSPSPARGRT